MGLDAQTSIYIGQIYEITPPSSPAVPGGGPIQYITAGSLRVAMRDDSGNVTYFLPDHLGSTSVMVDTNQTQVRTNQYTPFGSTYQTSGSKDSDYKFTGQRLDDTTGLYYYGARYYDPILGRFITPDTIVQSPYDPQSLNRYTYCRNNPIRLTDPSGHLSFGDWWRGVSDMWHSSLPFVNNSINNFFQEVCPKGSQCTVGDSDKPVGIRATTNFGSGVDGDNGNGDVNFGGSGSTDPQESQSILLGGSRGSLDLFRSPGYGDYTAFAARPDNPSDIQNDTGHAWGDDSIQPVLGPITGLIGAGSLLRGAGNGMINLYRAVQPEELADIVKTGQFINRGSAELKYFSLTATGASSYAKQAFYGLSDPAYTMVRTQIPGNQITDIMRISVDRGIESVVIGANGLVGLLPEIMTYMPISQK